MSILLLVSLICPQPLLEYPQAMLQLHADLAARWSLKHFVPAGAPARQGLIAKQQGVIQTPFGRNRNHMLV